MGLRRPILNDEYGSLRLYRLGLSLLSSYPQSRSDSQALVGNRKLKILDQDVQIAYSLFGGIADKRKLLKDDADEPL